MENSKINATYLKDYQRPDFVVESIDLHFELNEKSTTVHSYLKLTRQSKQNVPLKLHGELLKLISVSLNDQLLASHEYELSSTFLIIPNVPESFTLEIVTEIYPQKNTALTGLYRSGKLFCTQCEAEGFRRITYYFDRPDVMAPFTTTVVADKTRYPILLSNGNISAKGELSDNRHWVKWVDPFKKPSYLFALVAGDLAKISGQYKTISGRNVALEIFVEHENKEKCEHALYSLQKSMQWDEQNYGREYDLDIYMIVAVNDFNMGAMENKGLNIFNSKYILASHDTATDMDYQNIEAVVGHEYFHNWTGNRITCRDWFQLSLKEGLTVFREQQFSEDMGSAAVKRIQDARLIRTRQFAEDAGPMTHPVRPDSYIEINNFYTMTIYHKGAEVIRMLHTLLGKEKFRKGIDLYFKRYDGQAVTIEDFVNAFSDANDVDLTQFFRWYSQAGTPVVTVTSQYDTKAKTFTLNLAQHYPSLSNTPKKPVVIPIKIALYDEKGKTIALKANSLHHTEKGAFLILNQESQEFVFEQVDSSPVPSLLGNFSAPVKLSYPYEHKDLVLLLTSDEDLFNRWDASQRLCSEVIKSLMQDFENKQTLAVPEFLIEAYQKLLKQKITDPALLAQLLILPSFQYIGEEFSIIPVEALLAARKALIETFAKKLKAEFAQCYQVANDEDDGSLNKASMGYRSLKNICLYYLIQCHEANHLELANNQYLHARNMTDIMGALGALNHSKAPLRQSLFEDFYVKFKADPLVVNKWLALQASSELPNTLESINALLSHEAFDIQNPNKVYALINTFGASNPDNFHDAKGRGYDFLAQRVIELNKINPQVAARVLESLTPWKRLDEKHGLLMKNALQKIQSAGQLSEDVYEIVTKSL